MPYVPYNVLDARHYLFILFSRLCEYILIIKYIYMYVYKPSCIFSRQ